MKPATEHHPGILLFFIPFIVISTFVVLNLFLGVIVEGTQTPWESRKSADGDAAQAATDAAASAAHMDRHMSMAEVRALRLEIAGLRAERGLRQVDDPGSNPGEQERSQVMAANVYPPPPTATPGWITCLLTGGCHICFIKTQPRGRDRLLGSGRDLEHSTVVVLAANLA